MSFLTLSDIARELRCSRHHARHLVERRGLPCINIGTSDKKIPRIPSAAFDEWCRAQQLHDPIIGD
jgi:Helix-turn-helix domain